MMPEVRVQPPALVDPRAPSRTRAVPLAPRLSSLQGRRVLLFDNGKLTPRSEQHARLYQQLAKRLPEQYGVCACPELRRDLSPGRQGAIRQVAEEIAAIGVDGVVLALCDAGGTASTIVLAWELERRQIPTVTLCSGQTIHLAAAMSLPVLPGLPLSRLNIFRYSSAADIAAETVWLLGEIGDAFTTVPEQLQTQFLHSFAPEHAQVPRKATGELHIWDTRVFEVTEVEESTITLDPAEYAAEVYEAFCDGGLCDGLPIIPPTRSRVDAMLVWTDRPAADVVIPRCFPSGAPLTIGTLAVNAVMAGCRPEYFPLVVTAALAVAEPRYRLMQAAITSYPAGNAILVSGPLAREVGLASGGGCLGPGYRANIAISRAVNMSLVNAGRALPGQADLSTIGSPAELAFCCAEHIEVSPWEPLHVELFDTETTSVTVLKCVGPHNVLDYRSTNAEGILRGVAEVAATLGRNSASVPAELLVMLNPEHAWTMHADGWSKRDVQRFLCEQARVSRRVLEERGIVHGRPTGFAHEEQVPVVSRPDDVLLLVAGTHGPHSMVGMSWGYSRAVTRAVTSRDGQPVRHLNECRQT